MDAGPPERAGRGESREQTRRRHADARGGRGQLALRTPPKRLKLDNTQDDLAARVAGLVELLGTARLRERQNGFDDGSEFLRSFAASCKRLSSKACRTSSKMLSPARSKWPSQATPPPAWMFCPVIQRASSLARKAATSATSSGVPMRLKGD